MFPAKAGFRASRLATNLTGNTGISFPMLVEQVQYFFPNLYMGLADFVWA